MVKVFFKLQNSSQHYYIVLKVQKCSSEASILKLGPCDGFYEVHKHSEIIYQTIQPQMHVQFDSEEDP
jgi:hypothetical protein